MICTLIHHPHCMQIKTLQFRTKKLIFISLHVFISMFTKMIYSSEAMNNFIMKQLNLIINWLFCLCNIKKRKKIFFLADLNLTSSNIMFYSTNSKQHVSIRQTGPKKQITTGKSNKRQTGFENRQMVVHRNQSSRKAKAPKHKAEASPINRHRSQPNIGITYKTRGKTH